MSVSTKSMRGLLAAAAVLASTAALADLPKEIVFGVAGPITGPNAQFGEQLNRGATMAVEDINAKGGINGSKVKLVVGDDACEAKQAVAVANRFVDNDKVNAVIGHFCSSTSIPASDVYAAANILEITPASTNPKFTDRGLKNVFRTCGRDDQQGTVAANYIVDNLKGKNVAVVHDKTTYGQGLADAMRNQLNKRGVKEVLYEGITQGEKDFNALVTKLRTVNADVVYFGGYAPEAGQIVKQMREQGLKATSFMSGDGITDKVFLDNSGGWQFAEGVYMTFGADARDLPESQSVVKKFRDAKYEPEGYTLYSYAAVQAAAEAMKATKSVSATDLAAWLKKNAVQTVMGPKSWDEKGDLKVSDYVMYRWSQADGTKLYHMVK